MPEQEIVPATRDRILRYMQENRTATVVSLSRTWGLTRADIRYHMNRLLEEGLVEVIPRNLNLPSPRGRPVQVYRLAVGATARSYIRLCSALLMKLLSGTAPDKQEMLLAGIASTLGSDFRPSGTAVQRLNQVMDYLNHQNYHARWEASPVGPRILLRSCPFAAILTDFPQLCALDRHLLEQLTGRTLRQVAKMDLAGQSGAGKPPHCVFASAG